MRYKELLLMLTYRDISIRYKQSIMGFLWAVLMPSLIVLAGILIRYGYSVLTGIPLKPDDVASIAVRSLPWAFTVSALRFGTTCLISNVNLVTKIYFPREVFPITAVAAASFDLLIASGALIIALIFLGTGVSVQLLWLPLLIAILVCNVAGAAMIFSAAALFFRDVKYIMEIILTFGIFFSPVFFSASTFGKYGDLLLLNPIAPILEAADATIVQHMAPDPLWTLYSGVTGVLLLWFGYRFFKNLEPAFAESI